jgi:hypothetical protein
MLQSAYSLEDPIPPLGRPRSLGILDCRREPRCNREPRPLVVQFPGLVPVATEPHMLRHADDGILDIPVPEVVLDQPRFRALFGEIEAGCLYRDQSA